MRHAIRTFAESVASALHAALLWLMPPEEE